MLYMIHGVTGPNEYDNNVNNNWYTNYSCVQCLQSTIECLEMVAHEYPEEYNRIRRSTEFRHAEETARWKEIIEKMAQRGVATNVHYKPLPLLTAYKDLGFDIADYPCALAQFENEITLPLYSTLTEEDVRYICQTLKVCLQDG